MNTSVTRPHSADLSSLTSLVIKEHVALGGLGEAERRLALALAWASLPRGVVLTEGEVNEALKACLAGPAAFLATDHVELRRWLVDMGWLTRDGFGREYRAAAAAEAPTATVALRLSALDLGPWVREQRALHAARRAERRGAWEARQAALAALAPMAAPAQ